METTQRKSIASIVREAEDNYVNGTAKRGKYVEWNMHETLETIDAYLNSKHTSGDMDSLGREKPFFNIVTAAANIWYRATDLDRKDIRILPDSVRSTTLAFVATVVLQQWMKDSRFGMFLNDWGRVLARYGSAVCKFVEKDGDLSATVVPWNRLIVDPLDFAALPVIEKLYMTPAQLREMALYDQDIVEELLEKTRARNNLDRQTVDNSSNFIEVYEIHGKLPTYLLEDDPDEAKDTGEYRQQMHVISFIAHDNGEYTDFCLYKGREKKNPYMITHLIPEDGRTLAVGAVEHLFFAQWMKNHTIKNMKDTLDLSSKLIFQTSDGNYMGRNVLSAIETGDILIHKMNEPLTQINNSKADIQAFQAFGMEWERIGQELTSTPDALRGQTLPSGTPYSLGAYLGQQANSLFEVMTENKGLYIEDMMREYVLPFLKTKMDTKDEIVAVLDSQNVAEIDTMFVPREAARRFNREALEKVLNDEIPSPYQKDVAETQVREELRPLGNMRAFKPSELDDKTWKELFKDFEWKCTVEVTNEQTDKQAVLQTLSTLLQTVASNPMVLQDENARTLFNHILTETGRISPVQLSRGSATALPPGGSLPISPINDGAAAEGVA